MSEIIAAVRWDKFGGKAIDNQGKYHTPSAVTASHNTLLAQVAELKEANERYRKALEEIREGYGRFSTDPFTHAVNTIDDMKALAVEALHPKQEEQDAAKL